MKARSGEVVILVPDEEGLLGLSVHRRESTVDACYRFCKLEQETAASVVAVEGKEVLAEQL